MILNFDLAQELFRAFHIQRWNDRVRPMELFEMDKHAHKMMIAYCLGKYEEGNGSKIDWTAMIQSGIFELLRRIVISDIKSPIYSKIRKNKPVFRKLNEYVFSEVGPKFENRMIKDEFHTFLFDEDSDQKLHNHILDAAHIFASYWEFRLIRQINPVSYQNIEIESALLNTINSYKDLIGIRKLTNRHTISNFIDLFGQMRFQVRWAQLPRVPKTSVLGHSMQVACLAYFLTRDNDGCDRRIFNNFFGGLFHDLPEAVTRDIISPVKRSSAEFEELLSEIEDECSRTEIFPLLEPEWINEIQRYTYNEFVNKVSENGKAIEGISVEEINEKYNNDINDPYDGQIIRAADHFAAFLEVWNSCISGIQTEELCEASRKIRKQYAGKVLGKSQMYDLYCRYKQVCP